MKKNTKAPEAKVAINRKKIGGEVPMVVSEITDKCLYSGFFGTLDSARIKTITDKILYLLTPFDIETVIIDLGNVDIIDSAVAARLIRLNDTLKFLGVQAIFCGIMPIVAQMMVNVGIEMKGFKIARDLKSALKEVFALQGLKLVRINPEE
ncbi:MAG: STAS domain-containing protein [Deltaproteobacteria bacterium]|nr:STAS domain-containing protein [Deltaproteobacteria bacterium]MBW2051319.1 STAS domain-containing protein [Deltaproteobacteria bacterium]MBW2141192.1 STAS domain-containing protein [Deltaproteobacteria bacterium]